MLDFRPILFSCYRADFLSFSGYYGFIISNLSFQFFLITEKSFFKGLSPNDSHVSDESPRNWDSLFCFPHDLEIRLQNSPYFCVFKYARAVKRGWKQRARLGRDAKNTFFFSLASHALRECEDRALRARKTLTPRFTDFFTDFEKKTDCFAVYLEIGSLSNFITGQGGSLMDPDSCLLRLFQSTDVVRT